MRLYLHENTEYLTKESCEKLLKCSKNRLKRLYLNYYSKIKNIQNFIEFSKNYNIDIKEYDLFVLNSKLKLYKSLYHNIVAHYSLKH